MAPTLTVPAAQSKPGPYRTSHQPFPSNRTLRNVRLAILIQAGVKRAATKPRGRKQGEIDGGHVPSMPFSLGQEQLSSWFRMAGFICI